jgi:hypothetical protein
VGVELDDALVKEARLNAQKSGLDDRITILKQNALDVDYTYTHAHFSVVYVRVLSRRTLYCCRDASVVTMYLSEHGNKKMKDVLNRFLKPGARVVAYQFPGMHTHTHTRMHTHTHAVLDDAHKRVADAVAGWVPDKVHKLASGQRLFLFHYPPKTSSSSPAANNNNNEASSALSLSSLSTSLGLDAWRVSARARAP